MTPKLSVIIAYHNEPHLKETVRSILSTGGSEIQVVLVDDGSAQHRICVPCLSIIPGQIRYTRNPSRRGVGAARHQGVKLASAPLILITDAHMLFDEGWLKPVLDAMATSESLMLCGQTVGLDEDARDLNAATSIYNGANMVISDPPALPRWRILSAKWRTDRPGQDNYPLSAVMGALYVMHKSWYHKIGGLRLLKEFGGDEEMLSIKTLRAGGEIRMFKKLRAGHRFRTRTKPGYRISEEMCLYNTMAVAHVCCPPVIAGELIKLLGDDPQVATARELVRQNHAEIAAERDALGSVWVRNWPDYLKLIASIDA